MHSKNSTVDGSSAWSQVADWKLDSALVFSLCVHRWPHVFITQFVHIMEMLALRSIVSISSLVFCFLVFMKTPPLLNLTPWFIDFILEINVRILLSLVSFKSRKKNNGLFSSCGCSSVLFRWPRPMTQQKASTVVQGSMGMPRSPCPTRLVCYHTISNPGTSEVFGRTNILVLFCVGPRNQSLRSQLRKEDSWLSRRARLRMRACTRKCILCCAGMSQTSA